MKGSQGANMGVWVKGVRHPQAGRDGEDQEVRIEGLIVGRWWWGGGVGIWLG